MCACVGEDQRRVNKYVLNKGMVDHFHRLDSASSTAMRWQRLQRRIGEGREGELG